MKLKQKLLLVSALSCAALAAIGYLAKSDNKEEDKTELITDTEEKEN